MQFLRIFTVSIFLIILAPTIASATPQNLTLSPLRSELEISPGTSHSGTIKIKNSSERSIKVQLSAEAFSVINPQYDYAFDAESKLADWVQFDKKSIELGQGESADIDYKVGVPISAEPGGRYISLFAVTDTDSENSLVSSRQRIGSLLYVTVLGEVTRFGEVVSTSSPKIVLTDSETLSFQLRNSGSTHYRSKYEFSVESLFGGVTKSISGESLILPGTIRRINEQLIMPTWPGIYKLHSKIGLGDNPKYDQESYFVYIPIWLIFLLSAATAGIYTFRKVRKTK